MTESTPTSQLTEAQRIERWQQSIAAHEKAYPPRHYVEPTGQPYGHSIGGGQSLKEFLANPPADVLEMIAKTDPVLAAKLREDKAKTAAAAFMAARPEYLNTDDNYEAIMRAMARTHLKKAYTNSEAAEDDLVDAGYFTVENITKTYTALLAAGRLEVKRGQTKKLNREELREIAIAVETKGIEFAILDYMAAALGGLPDDLDGPDDLLAKHGDLCSEAVLHCWPEARALFVNSPEWIKFFRERRSGRVGVLTVATMDQLWADFKATPAAQRSTAAASTGSIAPAPDAQPDYSDMSDAEIATLHEQASRLARVRRNSGQSWQPEPPQY